MFAVRRALAAVLTPWLLLVAGAFSGCSAPSTDAVCERLARLTVAGPAEGASEQPSEEVKQLTKLACMEEMTAAQETNSSAYAKKAACIMKAEDRLALRACKQ